MNIHQSIVAAMADIGAIEKGRTNTTQNFKFRGIDDVYNALHDILAKHGIFTTSEILSERSEERPSKNGGLLIYRVLMIRYTFFAADGSMVQSTVIGEGMDSGDKASNKAMAVAHKYALLQVFCIPTVDEKDPDAESHELADAPKVESPVARMEPAPQWKVDIRSAIALLKATKLNNVLIERAYSGKPITEQEGNAILSTLGACLGIIASSPENKARIDAAIDLLADEVQADAGIKPINEITNRVKAIAREQAGAPQ